MAMAIGTFGDSSSSIRNNNSNPLPGLRQQLRCITSIYQTLTNLYFLLIEQSASTGINASTKNAISQQMNELVSLVRGEDANIANGTNARSQGRNNATTSTAPNSQQSRNVRKTPVGSGISNELRPEYANRIKEIPLFNILIRSNANSRNASSSTSSLPSNHFIPSLGQTIESIEEINLILNELMKRADQHSINQARIRQLINEIEQRDTTMIQSIRRLSVLRDRCNRLVKLGKEEQESITIAEQKPLGYKEILQYARTLSQTTTAPPGFKLPSDDYSDPIDQQEGGEDANKDEAEKFKPVKRLYQLAKDDEDETEVGSGRIPARYQNKLPFPSIDAIRRGASIVQTPTWEMFQRGILQVDQEVEAGGNEQEDEQMQEEAEQMQHRNVPAQYHRRAQPQQPVEEEEEGFGLDLN